MTKSLPFSSFTPLKINIQSTAAKALQLVDDAPLRLSLEAAYASNSACRAVESAEALFDTLTSRLWDKDAIARFLSGWYSTHGSALYVSGLIIRITRLADGLAGKSGVVMRSAASEVCEVIPEDTGVDDTPHHQLFSEFATGLLADDRWKLDSYRVTACDSFRKQMMDRRLRGDIEEAILFTAASEHWNTGEYEYLNSTIRPWVQGHMGINGGIAEDSLSYITHHCGDTELGHFLHMIRAWKFYCEAMGIPADPEKARNIFETYLAGVDKAFQSIRTAAFAAMN